MKGVELYRDADHQWLILGRDPGKPENIMDTNQFLVLHSGRGLLAEPGGIELFAPMLRSVLEYIAVEDIQDVFVSHQDPDLTSSLGLWDDVLPNGAFVHGPWMWEGFLRHFGLDHMEYKGIPDNGGTIAIGGLGLQAIPAHFCHSSGNFQLYDPEAKLLMSGDMGMAVEPGQSEAPFFCRDFDSHIRHMEPLHRRWMPSSQAILEWVERVQHLDIQLMAPQHGRVLWGEDIQRFLNWVCELKVGPDENARG